jgi:antitoxin component YwqK of YwqJK toxin-antitoxin module
MPKGVKNYRSSIPRNAKERITARHIKTRKKAKAEYWLRGKVVGVRFFDEAGGIQAENPRKHGLLHGTLYCFHSPAQLEFAESYAKGLAHGTARQWSEDGALLGTYTMKRGTGVDLWRQGSDWGHGLPYLSEARYLKDGKFHGFEWWINEDQRSVWQERHFKFDKLHGIERDWNSRGRLRRGFPRYWVNGARVVKRQCLRACVKDSSLPRFRKSDNRPERKFPPEIVLCKPSRELR